MSRTIRRKHVKPEDCFQYKILKRFFGDNWWKYEVEDLPEKVYKEYKKENDAYFHSDRNCKCSTGKPPAWYRREQENIYRSRCKTVKININKGDYEDYIYPLYRFIDYW